MTTTTIRVRLAVDYAADGSFPPGIFGAWVEARLRDLLPGADVDVREHAGDTEIVANGCYRDTYNEGDPDNEVFAQVCTFVAAAWDRFVDAQIAAGCAEDRPA